MQNKWLGCIAANKATQKALKLRYSIYFSDFLREKIQMAAKAAGESGKKVNKSQAILKFYKSNPNAKPRHIVEALTRRGVDVNAQYVSTILFNYRRGTEGRSEMEGAAEGETKKVALAANGVSAREIMLAKMLVKQSGSVGAAKKALELYSDIIA